LRAIEIDTDHKEPRAHFILAQVYEAKGDSAAEAEQLREYLKYADDRNDIAWTQQYLDRLEKQPRKAEAVNSLSDDRSKGLDSASTHRWRPANVDDAIPPVVGDACPLTEVLKQTSRPHGRFHRQSSAVQRKRAH